MKELKCRLYCLLHYVVKKILGRSSLTAGEILRSSSFSMGVKIENAVETWNVFIGRSLQYSGKYCGLPHAGFIAENNEWCLPSWIWTSSATVRELCLVGKLDQAKVLANKLADYQQECGGWIVRNDYDKKGAIPVLAPNDSAYIANNCFLSIYEKTRDTRYIDIARKCADWIIKTARFDGMVYVGYNIRDEKWYKSSVIVDVGFTAGLFARLVEFTNEEKYLNFLRNFIARYIELFYIPNKHGFCTSIDVNNHQQGGMFGRGQAWALEGLIPSYRVLKDKFIKKVIDDTILNLVCKQHKDGGWAYNFTKPLLGIDCKAVSVIAKNMMDWYSITQDDRIRLSAKKALDWCCKHTAVEGDAIGGIFSFCMEGAIVQNLYTSCAFVYSSVYAIELYQMLER